MQPWLFSDASIVATDFNNTSACSYYTLFDNGEMWKHITQMPSHLFKAPELYLKRRTSGMWVIFDKIQQWISPIVECLLLKFQGIFPVIKAKLLLLYSFNTLGLVRNTCNNLFNTLNFTNQINALNFILPIHLY